LLDLTVHDADLLHFLLGDVIVEVSAMTANSGMASSSIEDTALTTGRTARGVLVYLHDVFNTPFNCSSVEVHGTRASLIARDCMTQAPIGSVTLRDAQGERELPMAHENLYVRGLRRFVGAVRGEDTVSCTGRDGVRSLAVALAALQSAGTGRSVRVHELQAC
jgi:1,5-anhydro-D-fructose reductase (1,5-anhydro-D-mannitol-forming)